MRFSSFSHHMESAGNAQHRGVAQIPYIDNRTSDAHDVRSTTFRGACNSPPCQDHCTYLTGGQRGFATPRKCREAAFDGDVRVLMSLEASSLSCVAKLQGTREISTAILRNEKVVQ